MAARKTNKQGMTSTAKRGGRLAPGEAPPISFENARRARENISAKISLIEKWAKKISSPDERTDEEALAPFSALPRSQRDFNAWDSSALPSSVIREHGPFHKNGNATLLKNQDLHSSLLQYFKILKQSEVIAPAQRRLERIASLHRRLAMEKVLRSIAEKELARARAQLWQSQKMQEVLQAELRSAEKKAEEIIEELQQRLAQISAERAELIGTVKKVSGIRRISK